MRGFPRPGSAPGRLGRRAVGLALAATLAIGLVPQPGLAAVPSLATSTIQSGLAFPWDVAFLPNGQMLVTERPGRIRVYASGSPGAALIRTVTVPSVRAEGEAGVMGIAVDTDFARHRFVYVCASRSTSSGWRNQVLRYAIRSDGRWADLKVLVPNMRAGQIHNGCAVEMDQGGRLWVSMGESGRPQLAQDRNSLNGKILRMTRNGGVPSDNPVIDGKRDLVYSMGHRNPQGIALRPGTNQVFAIEHGPMVNDEINRIVAGGNYGWPCYTGDGTPHDLDGPAPCGPASDYLPPLWASGATTLATSGGTFVGGSQWGDYAGQLFVSTLKQSDIRRFTVNAGGTTVTSSGTLFNERWGRLRASVRGPGGQLYVTTSNAGQNDRVIRISPATPVVARIAGADRYATAAAMSASTFPNGVPEVMIATGEQFPDALAGSAAAGNGNMPILLVTRRTIPPATRAELQRLDPERIWVLGGSGVISPAVRAALESFASSGQATRIAGADRYATAAAVSRQFFAPGVGAAFVATGTSFADALSGAPAAALLSAPLLLVQQDGIPSSIRQELNRLDPGRIYVLGGTAVVGASVLDQLRGFTDGPVKRLSGANRYATATAITREFWVQIRSTYVANGLSFPDALAGAAAAGSRGRPVLLSAPTDVPFETGQELLRLVPARVTMLGGSGVLGAGVTSRLRLLVAIP